jgi:outer membrane immunogenic protein
MSVRRLVLALGVLSFGSVGAMAADMPVKAPLVVPPPPYSWTGCYIGANAGYGWQRTNSDAVVTNGVPGYFVPAVLAEVGAAASGSLDSSGFTGGGQVGCNFQSGQFVWGVEGDFNWFKQDAAYGGRFLYSTNGAPYFVDVSDEKKWLATVRGRLGFAIDRIMIYATGGLAIMDVNFTQTFTEPPATVPPFGTPALATFSKTKFGWTAGAGVEGAVGGCCWTVKAEYLFARFESETVTGVTSFAARTATFTNTVGPFDVHIVRVGLNYRFGGKP